VKYSLTLILLFSSICFGQISSNLSEHLYYPDSGGLEKIIRDRYIRVLTTNNSVNYFLHNGKPTGVQFELVKKFVKALNTELKLSPPLVQFEIVPAPKDQLVPLLLEGRGDLIAADLSNYENIVPEISFSKRLREIKKVLVVNEQYKTGDYFYSNSTIKYSLIKSLQLKPSELKVLSDGLSEQDLLELSSIGQFNAVVVDYYIGKYFSDKYSNLNIYKVQQDKLLPSSWVVRKENQKLLGMIDQFIPSVSVGSFLGNFLDLKYKKSYTTIRFENDQFENKKISPFDNFLKKYGAMYRFDWFFLASLSFQESRFNQKLVSKAAAVGVFQVKESTAREPYVDIFPIRGEKNLENNIHAGVKYLSWIKKSFFDPIKKMREKDRFRFSLAAYNAGPSRVIRAMKLTKKKGLDPNKWFRNVELTMIDMGFLEPVRYVSEINKRYVAYQLLMK
jgi:membrane-bound lytic murein transglycosylase MltF